MKLTPIRVRGKRGQAKAEEKSKRHRLTSTGGDDGDNGGKDEHDKMDAAAETSVTASSRPRRSKPPPRLSQLPQEILERIFIASTNLALPLANRELYHRLTSTSVRYQLIAAAFGPTWDAWYGVDAAEVQSYDGWMVDAHRIAGNPAFQVRHPSTVCFHRPNTAGLTMITITTAASPPSSPARGPSAACSWRPSMSGSASTPMAGRTLPFPGTPVTPTTQTTWRPRIMSFSAACSPSSTTTLGISSPA